MDSVVKIPPIEAAWMAGLFEGEGCIFEANGRGRLSMESTDYDVIARFCRLAGVGTLYEKPRYRVAGNKPIWRWNCGRRSHVEALLRVIMPWLGERRYSKAQEVVLLPLSTYKKITDDQVRLIREAVSNGWPVRTLARELCLPRNSVRDIALGITRKNIV